MTTSSLDVTPVAQAAPGETFRPHPAWAHLQVSTEGRVWSDKAGRFVGYRSGRARRTSPSGLTHTWANDYLRVKVDGRRSAAVHALVLETYVGPRPADHDGDHRNHDGLDNRLANLRWRPVGENRADTAR